MNRAALIAVVLLAARPASAGDDRPTAASRAADVAIAAVIADAGDVARTVLVGPSGQRYQPDGAGHWTRRAEGGVAADVSGAALVDGDVVVAGHATPLYQARKGTWFTLELGEDGRTVMAQGPGVAVAVGKAVLVHEKVKGRSTWTRVGSLPGKATLLWADGKDVWAATDAALYRLRGGKFTKKGSAPRALVGGTPWAVTDDGLVDLDAGRTCPATLDGAAVTVVGAGGAAGDGTLTVVADTGAGLVLARTSKGGKALERVDALPAGPTGAVAGVVVAGSDVLVAFATGDVVVRHADAWTTTHVQDELPHPHPGSGAAHTR